MTYRYPTWADRPEDLRQELTAARQQPNRTPPEESHAVCECDPETALCGLNVSNAPWAADDTPLTCIVCHDLDDQPCQSCDQ